MIYRENSPRSTFIIKENGEAEKLCRIPFMTNTFNEAWLQEILADNPSLVPSQGVGEEYAQLVCIGREVPVGSGEGQGYIDNLYISPSGSVVLVETKLFRNQEARRTVVAQIIEYAKELQKWDAEKLNSVCVEYSKRTTGKPSGIIDIMKDKGYLSSADEASFTDRINHRLSKASFLLMIIGDGIRSSVQQLAEFLNDNTNMAFNLALAEIEVYSRGAETIVIPNLLTKTTVIERRTYGAEPQQAKTAEQKQYIQKPVLSRQEFLSKFAEFGGIDSGIVSNFIDDLEAVNGLSIGIAPTELTIRFRPDTSKTYPLLTFSISGGRADIYIMPSKIKESLSKHGILPSMADTFLEAFKRFIDTNRCKAPPYEYEKGYYYTNVAELLSLSNEVLKIAEQFAVSLSSNQ